MRICIDPGHGGRDPGAVATHGGEVFREADIVWHVAMRLEKILAGKNIYTRVTREPGEYVELEKRAESANQFESDLFVSIHANAALAPEAEGIEVWHYTASANGEAWANAVYASLAEAFPDHKNRGVREANFAVLRETTMAAILVELEFLTNPDQARFLAQSRNKTLLARAIARGVENGRLEAL